MLEFLIKNNIISLEDIDDIREGMTVVEYCKDYSEDLSCYCLAIPDEKKQDIIHMYEKFEPENAAHVTKILGDEKGLKVVYTSLTRRYSISLTDYIFEYFNNDIDDIFSYFGYEALEEPVVEEVYPSKQSFETTPSYIDMKEEEQEQRNTFDIRHEEIPDNYDTYEEVSNVSEPVNEVKEPEIFTREEIEELSQMICQLDSSISQTFINSILVMYDSGEQEFATNKIITLLSQLQEKGLIN